MSALAQEAADLRTDLQRQVRRSGASQQGTPARASAGGPQAQQHQHQPSLSPMSGGSDDERSESAEQQAQLHALQTALLRARSETHAALLRAAQLASERSAASEALAEAQARAEECERQLSESRAAHARAALGEARAMEHLNALRYGNTPPPRSEASTPTRRGDITATSTGALGTPLRTVAATTDAGAAVVASATLAALAAENDVLRSELRRLLLQRAGLAPAGDDTPGSASGNITGSGDTSRLSGGDHSGRDSQNEGTRADDRGGDSNAVGARSSPAVSPARATRARRNSGQDYYRGNAGGEDRGYDSEEGGDDRTASVGELDELLREADSEGPGPARGSPRTLAHSFPVAATVVLPLGTYSPMQGGTPTSEDEEGQGESDRSPGDRRRDSGVYYDGDDSDSEGGSLPQYPNLDDQDEGEEDAPAAAPSRASPHKPSQGRGRDQVSGAIAADMAALASEYRALSARCSSLEGTITRQADSIATLEFERSRLRAAVQRAEHRA